MGDLDSFAEELQEKILKDVEAQYSPVVIRHWQYPRNWGIMNNAHGYGKITGPCGDTMEISIMVKNNMITKCTFDTDGCGTTIACGSIITEMASGQKISEARHIDYNRVIEVCGGLPQDSRHCALLAANTLQAAIDNYEHSIQE